LHVSEGGRCNEDTITQRHFVRKGKEGECHRGKKEEKRGSGVYSSDGQKAERKEGGAVTVRVIGWEVTTP